MYIDLNEHLLTEALNNPQEFYLTDDTVMPSAYYGRFSIDDMEYTMGVFETQMPNVYDIKLGRISGKSARYWKFHKPNHILPALATLMRFVESVSAFAGPKIKGLFVNIKAKKNVAVRMARITEKIVKRSYIKSFTFVPTEFPDLDKPDWLAAVIVKKGISPKSIFNKGQFKKVNWDGNSDLPDDITKGLQELPLKKVIKKSLTDEPSKKFFVGFNSKVEKKAEFNPEIDDEEFLDMVNGVVALPEKAPEKPTDLKYYEDFEQRLRSRLNVFSDNFGSFTFDESRAILEVSFNKKILETYIDYNMISPDKEGSYIDAITTALDGTYRILTEVAPSYEEYMEIHELSETADSKIMNMYVQIMKDNGITDSYLIIEPKTPDVILSEVMIAAHLISKYMEQLTKSIGEKGYNSTKMKWDNFRISFNQNFPYGKDRDRFLDIVGDDTFTDSSAQDIINQALEMLHPSHSSYDDISLYTNSMEVKDEMETAISGLSYNQEEELTSKNGEDIVKSTIDPKTLKSGVPGQPQMMFNGKYWVKDSSDESDIDSSYFVAEAYITNDLGYGYDKKYTNHTSVKSYTGSAYSNYNSPIRSIVEGITESGEITQKYSGAAYDIANKGTHRLNMIWKSFDTAEPFPVSLWVYRGFTSNKGALKKVTEPGMDFVNPGVTSTSIKPDISFGHHRMRIFVPKGSKILPALTGAQSNHPGEFEIILPAMSVLKIIERVDTNSSDDYSELGISAIYMGSAYPAFRQFLKENLTDVSEENINLHISILENIMNKKLEDNDYDPNEKFGGKVDTKALEKLRKMIQSKSLKITNK